MRNNFVQHTLYEVIRSEKAVKSDIPLFVCHANEKICSSESGWASEDQILKQMISSKKIAKYQGSAFTSYTDLVKNTITTGALVKYYLNQIDENSRITSYNVCYTKLLRRNNNKII